MGRPVDQDLRRLLIKLLGNVNDLGLVNDSRFSSGVITKRRVGGDNNVLLLALRKKSQMITNPDKNDKIDLQYLKSSGWIKLG